MLFPLFLKSSSKMLDRTLGMRLDDYLVIETYHTEVRTCSPYSPAFTIVTSTSTELLHIGNSHTGLSFLQSMN